MAVAETARLIASLELQDKLSRPADKAIGKLAKLEGAVGGIGAAASKGLKTAGKAIAATAAIGGVFIATQVQSGLQSLAELEDATTQVDAAIKQMGKSGQVTAGQIAQWANEIEAATDAAFDDKAITASAATLIRYGKVTTKNLRPALVVMTDLAAKTGSVESASTLLARALADPAKAAGKLARAGVILTKSQQDQIKALVKAGKVGQAQTVILDALTKSTKGAAAASKGEYADSLNILSDTVEDAQRALAVGFLPVIKEVRDILTTELSKPSTINAIKEFGRSAAAGLSKLVDAARKVPWSAIGEGLRIAGQGAKTILDAFLGLPPWVQTAIVTGWGLNKLTGGALTSIFSSFAGGLIKGVLGMTAGVVNIKAATVTGVGGAGAAGATGAIGKAGGSLKNLVVGGAKLLGAFALLDLATQGLIDEFGRFQGKVAESQAALAKQVDATSQQGVKESIDNLTATVDNLRSKDFFSQVIGSTFGGAEISKNLVDAADRLKDAKNLTADELKAARDAIEKARSFAVGNFLDSAVPPLEQALATIDRRIATEGSIYADRLDRTSGAQIAAIEDTRSEMAGVRKAVEAVNKANIAQYRKANALTEKRNKTPFTFVKEATTKGKATGDTFAVIGNLVRAFTQGRTPWAQDIGNVKNHLANLQRLQASLLEHGDTKGAEKIGGYIKTLQGVLAGKLDKLKPPAAPKPLVPQKPGDTGSEAVGTRLSQPITTAIDKTTTAVTTGASTAAANAAIIANRQTIATTAINTQGAATKTAITAAGATTAAAIAATKATILSGDTRSEAALTRLQGATTAVRTATASGLAGVKGAANATAAAIRNKDLSVSVTVPVNNRTIISSRGIVSSQTYIARFNQRGIK